MINTINDVRAARRAALMTRESEQGFTLIELMVVIIIIGILTAIAIPAFLSQRQSAWDAAVKSELSNAAIAAASYATSHNGSYASMSVAVLTGTYGLTLATSDNLVLVSAAATTYVITSYNTTNGAAGHTYTVTTGTLTGPS